MDDGNGGAGGDEGYNLKVFFLIMIFL